MNVKQTKEIIYEFQESSENPDIRIRNIHRLGAAYGYLEAIKKAKRLEKIVRDLLNTGTDNIFKRNARKEFEKWEKEK